MPSFAAYFHPPNATFPSYGLYQHVDLLIELARYKCIAIFDLDLNFVFAIQFSFDISQISNCPSGATACILGSSSDALSCTIRYLNKRAIDCMPLCILLN